MVSAPLCQPPKSVEGRIEGNVGDEGVEGNQKIRDLFQIKRVNSVKKLFRCSFVIFHSLGHEDNFIWGILW